jgi:hypothetical protein
VAKYSNPAGGLRNVPGVISGGTVTDVLLVSSRGLIVKLPAEPAVSLGFTPRRLRGDRIGRTGSDIVRRSGGQSARLPNAPGKPNSTPRAWQLTPGCCNTARRLPTRVVKGNLVKA